MFGSEFLEIAIGISLFFLFVSLICSVILEISFSFFKCRAKILKKTIEELLQSLLEINEKTEIQNIIEKFYKNIEIFPLYEGKYKNSNLPSYIPSANFARAIIDIAHSSENKILKENIKKITGIDITTERDDENFQKQQEALEKWFNHAGERASGRYIKKSKCFLFYIGFIVSVIGNIDAIKVIKFMVENSILRESIIIQIENKDFYQNLKDNIKKQEQDTSNNIKNSDNYNIEQNITDISSIKDSLNTIDYPIGWYYLPKLDEIHNELSHIKKLLHITKTTTHTEKDLYNYESFIENLFITKIEFASPNFLENKEKNNIEDGFCNKSNTSNELLVHTEQTNSPPSQKETIDDLQKISTTLKNAPSHSFYTEKPVTLSWIKKEFGDIKKELKDNNNINIAQCLLEIENTLNIMEKTSIGFPFSIEGFSLSNVIGWLITALSVTLGAPFWFDILNKFMIVRSTLKPKK